MLSGSQPEVVARIGGTESAEGGVEKDAADLPVTAYYDNGRKWWKGTLVNGRLEGPWIRWDRSGAVMELGEYRDDVRFGT